MEGKEIISQANHDGLSMLRDGTFWMMLFLIVTGMLGRVLVSGEPFDAKKFAGEIALSIVGAAILYFYGILQSMSVPEMIIYGGLTGLGGVRLIEWVIKIIKAIRSATP